MIITEFKPQNEVLGLLKRYKRIFIAGCGSCAKQCKTGGEDEVLAAKKWLEKNDKEVTGWTVPEETCNVSLVKREFREHKEELKKAEAVLVMACGAGVASVQQAWNLRVYPALNTVSLSDTLRIGNFEGKCSLCGDCVLGETAGICPVTLCPKGMLNGPCGGVINGKCEVNPEEDCVWVKIYNTLESYNDKAKMENINDPKNYSMTRLSTRIKTRK